MTGPDVDDDGSVSPARLTAFSDGVVAIAITLLVLPLVDAVTDTVRAGLPSRAVITDNRPQIVAFLLSFVVIANLWDAHHRVFHGRERVPRRALALNMFWLLTIVVLPFPTDMIGAYPDDTFTLRFYVGTLLVSQVGLFLLTRAVQRGDESLVTSVAFVVVLAVAFVLTLVVPGLGYEPLLLLFVPALADPVLRRRRRGRRPASPSGSDAVD